MFSLLILGVPIAYLVVVLVLLIRKEPRGLELSLLFAVISVMTGIWAINQSRSSTAGIAFLGLPLMGALGGFLGLTFGRFRLSAEPSHRFGAWVGLAGALSLVAFNIASGAQERSKLAALPNDSMSSEILDTLANSPDLSIALEAVRNPNAGAETLERVFTIMRLDIWFAGNPATPREILDEISRASSDKSVIGALLENPSLDCGLLTQVGVNLMKRQKRDGDDPNVMRVSELVPKLCPKKLAP